ncbi:MAG: methyltransferase domain-containing protein [Candidatus Hydrogenedentes bacterium]|nr:methyltransferase domain-containing protein [Candidatus Hydrogenedentota bacterium]
MNRLNDSLVARLQCPTCRAGRLTDEAGALVCAGCAVRYDVLDGIPILLPQRAGDEDPSKRVQSGYYDEEVNPEFELNRPHGCGRAYQFLMDYKLSTALARIGDIRGRSLLSICCGSGMDAEFFANQGAHVVGLDISLENVRRAYERSAKYGFPFQGVVGDAECLPFQTNAVDVAFVHDGLHHLPEPKDGVREMCRAASHAICVVEPARAIGTLVMVKLGVSDHIEDAGNVVHRFVEDEFRAVAREMACVDGLFRRYFMFYKHEPGWFMRLFSTAPLFPLYKIGWMGLNRLLGPIGNKCMFSAHLAPPTPAADTPSHDTERHAS